MTTSLPDNLISDATRLLLPHMSTVEERDAWLTQAFYIRDRRLYDQISREGAPVVFATRCIKTLLDFGCLPGGKHALSVLLDALRLGIQEHSALDKLTESLDNLCAKRNDMEYRIPAPIAQPTLPVQTIDTPSTQRTPTVFLSYSHNDTALVQQLIQDLQAAGHACWIDTTDIKGGAKWTAAITEGINNSYAFITIVSRAGNESDWVQKEFLWAEKKQKRIFPIMVEKCDLPIYMMTLQYVTLYNRYTEGLRDLLAVLPAPSIVEPKDTSAALDSARPINQRALELEYLDRLRFEELLHTEKYTPMAGTAHIRTKTRSSITPVVIRPEFEYLGQRTNPQQETKTRKFEDIIGAIDEIRHAVILGEPGAGKTTTLWKLAKTIVDTALDDTAAPIPVLIRLGKWTNPDQPLKAFIVSELGGLGSYLDILLTSQRAVLLLDGLNEIPVAQQEHKAHQVQALFQSHPNLTSVVTCREQDYTLDLGFDRINITPLDALRIREFVTRYLGSDQGDELFWRLAGEEARLYEARFGELFSQQIEEWERVFWLDSVLPADVKWLEYHENRHRSWQRWLRMREHPSSLMTLARNPYMLLMMMDIYARDSELPSNRSEMFTRFIQTLLVRERIREEADALLKGLSQTSYLMQFHQQLQGEQGAVTVIERQEVTQFLGERLLYLANSASILSVDSESVRFTHQLLQDYFAAQHLRYLFEEVQRITANEYWPSEHWWQRTGWEEAAILLTGLYSEDCSQVVEWIASGNPEVAAQCIQRSGAYLPQETLERLHTDWISRLTSLERDPQPEARAAVGRALGLLNLDNRPGVGLQPNGLPDIQWMEVSAGEFIYSRGETLTLPTFFVSRYPITYAQFQAFIDAPDGYQNTAWWHGLWWSGLAEQQPTLWEQAFKFGNHPRENVTWYDAVAFCRWLSSKSDYEVRLPTEQEWDKAARGTDGREFPWGNQYVLGYANMDESWREMGPHNLRMTSAVGIYPLSHSPYGVEDACGNVWEWCLNKYDDTEVTTVEGAFARVLRGGSWGDLIFPTEWMIRYGHYPSYRDYGIGFRVVTSYPNP